jgi:hypothetical protein
VKEIVSFLYQQQDLSGKFLRDASNLIIKSLLIKSDCHILAMDEQYMTELTRMLLSKNKQLFKFDFNLISKNIVNAENRWLLYLIDSNK